MLRICVNIFSVILLTGEVFGHDAMSTGYLVVGSVHTGTSAGRSSYMAYPIETNAGNTTVYIDNYKGFVSQNYATGPQSIDVDYSRKLLYIFNRNMRQLQRVPFYPEHGFNDVTFTTLHSGVSRDTVKIKLDWISNNIYWIDPLFRCVSMQSLHSKGHYKILVFDNIERPTAITVDPINKYLFWSDIGSFPKIERSTLTGNNRQTIVSQGISSPTALDIDIKSSKLYWVDSIRDTIERSNFDGTKRQTITRSSSSEFFDVKVFSDTVFVIDLSTVAGLIHLYHKETGRADSGQRLLHSSTAMFTCLAFYAPPALSTDHCSSNPCESICVSETTGPVCLCQEGFVLNSDELTCSEVPDLRRRSLIWSNSTSICVADIRGIHDEMEYIQENKTCYTNIGSNISWLAVDSNERKAIFADGSNIFSFTFDDVHTKLRLTSSTETVTGLAIDWVSKNVFWCQGQNKQSGKIYTFSQTTTKTRTLISSDLNNPKALNILPFKSIMLWIDGKQGSYRIKKAHTNGTKVQTIVNWMDLSDPKDLTVDAVTNSLFFIDGNTFKSVKLDATRAVVTTRILQDDYNTSPLKIYSYKNHIILSGAEKVDIVSLTTSDGVINTLGTLTAVTDIGVVDIAEQPTQEGPCAVENGGCGQICIPQEQNRICQCDYGFSLEANNKTCSSEPLTDNFAYVSDHTHNKIYQVSLIDDSVRALHVTTMAGPTGLIYNDVTQRIIWGESTSEEIKSAKVDGTEYRMIADVGKFGAHPDRLALDYNTGNIYYTAVRTIGASNSFAGIGVVTSKGFHGKLISEGATPRAIAIDPDKGFIFWTDPGLLPSVLKRANIDGTNIVTLCTSMIWPNGLAIDITAKALYVTDGGSNLIYRCGYEVNTCVKYYEDPNAHLMDIKLLGNYLYYTAWNKVYITKLHKTNEKDIYKFANHAEFGRLDSIEVYSSNPQSANAQTHCTKNERGEYSTSCKPTRTRYTQGLSEEEQLHPGVKTPIVESTTQAPKTTSTAPKSTSKSSPEKQPHAEKVTKPKKLSKSSNRRPNE